MKNDLISRSELMQEVQSMTMHITGLRAGKGILSEALEEYKKSILKCIKEQPTAFNQEAVVQQLEELEKHYMECSLCEYNEGAAVGIKEAISIVRKGGV